MWTWVELDRLRLARLHAVQRRRRDRLFFDIPLRWRCLEWWRSLSKILLSKYSPPKKGNKNILLIDFLVQPIRNGSCHFLCVFVFVVLKYLQALKQNLFRVLRTGFSLDNSNKTIRSSLTCAISFSTSIVWDNLEATIHSSHTCASSLSKSIAWDDWNKTIQSSHTCASFLLSSSLSWS